MAPEIAAVPQLTDHLFKRSTALRLPLSGTFELTPVCNFSCKMCYVRKTPEQVKAHHRSALNAEDWLSIARQATDSGMLYLLLTGGEPFLYPDFERLYTELSKLGIFISINSNGSLLAERNIDFLKDCAPKRVNITLYGASDDTYKRLCGVSCAFSTVCRNIEALKNAGINVKLNCSLTPDNAKDIEKIVTFSKNMGVPLDVATYMFPPLRRGMDGFENDERFTPQTAAFYRLLVYKLQFGEQAYKKYLEMILSGSIPPPGLEEGCIDPVDGKIRCRAGKASFWITWDGWLTPCGMMPEPKTELKGKAFNDAWLDLTELSSKLILSGVCVNCPNQKICHSCAAMACTETGSVSGIPKYLCETVGEMRRLAETELKKL